MFSSLNLMSAFDQIRISDVNDKTGLKTPIGHLQFKILPCSLLNAPITFIIAMDSIFSKLYASVCV